MRMIFITVLLLSCPAFTLTYNVDPDEDRGSVELIESRGYYAQIHKIETADSYILTMYRIINKSDINSNTQPHQIGSIPKKPVVLQHGLLMSSADWLIASPGGGLVKDQMTDEMVPNNNLGFVLAAYGYDVWLSNSRGNRVSYELELEYSTTVLVIAFDWHVSEQESQFAYSINPTDPRFWKFSYDEMIKYDTPAVIEYVLSVTKREKLAWIGHSQGGMMMYGFLSEHPEQSGKIKPFIGLAPVTRVIRPSMPLRLLAQINIFNIVGKVILPYPRDVLLLDKNTHGMMKTACLAAGVLVCSNSFFMVMGVKMTDHLNFTRLPVFISHIPAGTSAQNLIHFGQNIKSGKFCKYDWMLRNYQVYGSFSPPIYDLGKIVHQHIILWSAINDALATPESIQFIRDSLTVKLLADELVPDDRYNHADFLYGISSGKLVYVKLLQYLNQYAE